MLQEGELKAFIPTVMPRRAKEFYNDILGLELLKEDDFGLEFDSNGIVLKVIIVPALTPQAFTVAGWKVQDIYREIESLTRKGVVFERLEFIPQDSLGVWMAPGGAKVAWFKDPDGNILSLSEYS